MNKKIGLLIVLVLLLTGCKANYVLKYEDGKFSEHLELISSESTYVEDEAHPTYEDLKGNDVSAINDGTEKWTVDNDSSMYDIKISHELKKSTLEDLTIISECFPLHTYKEGEGSLYYSAYGTMNCEFLDEGSTFTLETKNQVIDSNATEKKNNKYTWDLGSEKVKKEGIYFQILKDEKDEEIKKKNKSTEIIPWYVKFIISIIAIVAIVGAITFIKNRS